MRFHGLTLIAASALCLSACSEQEPASFASAQAAYDAKEFSQARVKLLSVLDQDAGNDDARVLLVETMLNLSDGYVAERYLNEIGDQHLDPVKRLELQARSLVVRGKAENAIELLEREENREEWSAELYSALLWAHLEAGTLEDQIDVLIEAVNLYPDSATIHARAAAHFKTLDDWEKVADAVGYSLEANPAHYEARLISGELAIRDGDLVKALEIYSALAEDYPDHALPVTNVAGLQLDLGQTIAAENTLVSGLARHPDFGLLNFQNARLHYAKGNFRKSADILQQFSTPLARYVPATILSAQVDIKLGNRDMARVQLAKAARHDRFVGEVERIIEEAELQGL